MAENLKVQIDFIGDSSKLRQQLESLAAAMGSLRKKTESYTKANNKLKSSNKEVAKQTASLTKRNKKLIAENKKLIAEIERLKASMEGYGKKQKGVGRGMFAITNKGRLLSNSFATIRSKLLLASFAASMFSATIGKLTSIYGQQEKAERKLSQAIGGNSTRLLEHASALQAKTTFGDEDIIAAQAAIAQYTNEEDQIKQLTEATLDFATAKGMDLKSAAELVGKSIGSSTNALQRYGIHVEGAVGSQERFNIAMESLTKDGISGQASAEAETFSGKMAQAKNIFGDVAELLGKQLVPFVEKAVDVFVRWGKKMLEQGETWNKFKLAIKTLTAPMKISFTLISGLVRWGVKMFNTYKHVGESISNFLTPVFIIWRNALSQVVTIVSSLASALGSLLLGNFQEAKESAQKAGKAFQDFSITSTLTAEQTENLTKQTEWLDEATGGLLTDYENLDETLKKVNKTEEDNKNNLDDKTKALLNQAILTARISDVTDALAQKQAFLNQTTLDGELEHKSYVKTLADFNKATEQNIGFTEAKSMAELEAYIEKTFQNEEEKKRLLEMIRLQKELNDTVAFGMVTQRQAKEEKIKAGIDIAKSLAGLVGSEKMTALIMLRIQQAEAIANAHKAYTDWYSTRPVYAKLLLAKGLLEAAAIEKQQGKVKSAALGADFITQGEQFLRVGDNPSGQERVQVTPLGNNRASAGGSGSGSVNVNINGNILGTDEFVRDTLIPSLEDSLGRNLA